MAAIVHSPGIRGAFIWDDNEYLVQNTAVQNWDTFPELWKPGNTALYCPMVTSTFWIEHKIWGLGTRDDRGILRAPGYRVTNLLLHAGSALLLFVIFQKLRLPGGVYSAWAAAALFAVHPVTVESVAWVAERKNTLCFFFLVICALFALRALGLFTDSPRKSDYFVALAFFLAALLSKIAAAFFPIALLILLLWRRGRVTRVELLKLIPFATLVILLGLVVVHWEHNKGGTTGPEFAFSPLQRLLIASNAICFQLGKIFWPYPNLALYPRFPIEPGKPLPAYLFLAPAALLLVTAALWIMRRRLSIAPLTALLLYIAALIPTLGFVSFYTMLYTFVADHFQYMALPFILIFVTESAALVAGKLSAHRPIARIARLVLSAVAAAALLVFSTLSYGVSHLYTRRALLWEFTLQHNPDSWVAIDQYAFARIQDDPDSKDFPLVAALLEKSIRLNPNQWHAYYAQNLLYTAAGMPEQAAAAAVQMDLHATGPQLSHRRAMLDEAAERAWSAIPQSETFRRARQAQRRGEWNSAIALYEEDLRSNPANDYAAVQIGFCRQRSNGNIEGAIAAYQRVLARRPDFADAWLLLGFALRTTGKEHDALAALEKARQFGHDEVLSRHPELLEIRHRDPQPAQSPQPQPTGPSPST